jgi:hypothetical protein
MKDMLNYSIRHIDGYWLSHGKHDNFKMKHYYSDKMLAEDTDMKKVVFTREGAENYLKSVPYKHRKNLKIVPFK